MKSDRNISFFMNNKFHHGNYFPQLWKFYRDSNCILIIDQFGGYIFQFTMNFISLSFPVKVFKIVILYLFLMFVFQLPRGAILVAEAKDEGRRLFSLRSFFFLVIILFLLFFMLELFFSPSNFIVL